MRTTSLLNVGPPGAAAAGGCSTARCRAATSANTKADARMMRRIAEDATSYAANDSRRLLVRFQDSAVVRDLAIDDRQHAFRIRQRVERNAKDVLRQDREVGQFAGGDRSLFVFSKLREC